MKIVNANQCPSGSLKEQGYDVTPNTYGYIYLAGEVSPPSGSPPMQFLKRAFSFKKDAKSTLLDSLKEKCSSLSGVRRADVFKAWLVPSVNAESFLKSYGDDAKDVHIARFDVTVLVECEDVRAAQAVRTSEAFQEIYKELKASSRHTHCMVAENVRRIAEVDKEKDGGIYLFNHFWLAPGTTTQTLVDVWEYTAGWWTEKANLTNSTPIVPVRPESGECPDEQSQYSLVNHCRWERASDVMPSLIFRPTLQSFVVGNFTANGIVSMPVLYSKA